MYAAVPPSLQENLFTDGGRKAELQAIQEMLDMGGRELPGSDYSVAAALLTFLSALAEPVVPTSLHLRCFECSGNATLCKQVSVYGVSQSPHPTLPPFTPYTSPHPTHLTLTPTHLTLTPTHLTLTPTHLTLAPTHLHHTDTETDANCT